MLCLVFGFNKALCALLNMKVSHDFAVNFDEDNPECAGKLSNEPTCLLDSQKRTHLYTSQAQKLQYHS